MNAYNDPSGRGGEDAAFVDAWLSNIRKTAPPVTQRTTRASVSAGVGAIKAALRRCLTIVEQLETTRISLQERASTMSSADWKRHTEEIGALRDELTSTMPQLQNVAVAKRALLKRSRKRSSKRERARDTTARMQESRAVAHATIDRWLEGMQDAVERARAEENMKKDADCVLAEVTKKRSEARKQLNLVAALAKLREVREAAAVQRGARPDADDRAAFHKTCAQLGEMWESSARTYAKEEQGLRIMLEQGDEKKVHVGKELRVAREWEGVLFGDRRAPANPVYWGLTAAERDFETFIAIRKSWDTFLCAAPDEGSSIPIGWVLPAEDAKDAWSPFLRT